jgi:TfoX/Sxy family transcriptional regulator of competence genes
VAYNETISKRIREALAGFSHVEEKFMFGGVCYMVNDKMCVGVVRDEMMCRIDPSKEEEALSRNGCRPMDFTGRPMRGYVFVSVDGLKRKKDFDYWISLCIEYNKIAKSSKKTTRNKLK